MVVATAMLRSTRGNIACIFGARSWSNVAAMPPPSMDDVMDSRISSPPLVFPESDRNPEKNNSIGFGFGCPSFLFGGSMELMAVPKRKVYSGISSLLDLRMGAGRKTQSFTALPTQDLATYYSTVRNLKKNHLGGVIFGCNKTSMEECLSKQLFGLPAAHFQYVKNISPGLPLFLFNYSDRKLHGIYEAASNGQMNINPYGWTTDGSERTQFPAQVQIRVRLQCQPLLEFQYKPIIADNYYCLRHFWFELDHAQTGKLISLLASVAVAPSMPLPKNSLKWRTKFEVITSHGKVDEPEFREQLISETKDSSLNSDSKIPVGKYDPSKAPVNVKEAEKAEQELIFIKQRELAIQCNRVGEGQDMFLSGYAGDSSCLESNDLGGL